MMDGTTGSNDQYDDCDESNLDIMTAQETMSLDDTPLTQEIPPVVDENENRSTEDSKPAISTQKRFQFYEPQEEEKDEKKENANRFCFYDDVTRQELAAVPTTLPKKRTTPSNQRLDSADDILRSLQATEEQRMQILGAARASDPDSFPASTNNTTTDPYESAIKDALDLLRKHRIGPPTPQGAAPAPTGRARTPREQDRLLQHRMDDAENIVITDPEYLMSQQEAGAALRPGGLPTSPTVVEDLTDVYEEHKLKARQRQERMAQYASRLQEFKNTLPADAVVHPWQGKQQTPLTSPSNDLHNDDIPHVHSNNEDSVGFSDLSHLSHSTREHVEAEVQKGVEKVLMAILERASSASRGRAEDDAATTQSAMSDAILQVIDELGLGRASSATSDASSANHNLHHKHSVETDGTATASKRSATSVVDELLAEDDCDDMDPDKSHMAFVSSSPASTHIQQWGLHEEKKLPDAQERHMRHPYEHVGEADDDDDDDKFSRDSHDVDTEGESHDEGFEQGSSMSEDLQNLHGVLDWDESNPNEAGYRIIRLSKSQLRRVEVAFESMINGLKLNSERQLHGFGEDGDAKFVRELREAERLLDESEETRSKGKTMDKKTPVAPPKSDVDTSALSEDELEDSHPDFPGVKTIGKGEMGDLEFFHLPIIFKSHVTGFEPTKDMVLEPGNVVAGQYLVESELGSAAFSTAYRCIDLSSEAEDGHEEVCLKVIKNTKDFFDQSLDEIKILELLRQTGQVHENHIVEMKCFFYYREHLVIVTELLRQNLFEFGKFILDNNEEPYFTIPRLAFVTRQALIALRFVHNLGLVHSDVKPENILLGSYSRAQIKLIDFGSSCYLTDRQSSYIQSRSYRAPEVVLGLPYDGKIDVWSLGCVVAEMFTGEVTFQNDSIVSMLSRIEAICGPFPRHMIAQGRQSGRFFTKSGLLYEVVDDADGEHGATAPGPHDDTDDDNGAAVQFDIFQPKNTRLCARLGFDPDLMDGFSLDDWESNSTERYQKQLFADFVQKMLTIDPDGRPSADEALQHPWMLYAANLKEEHVKYPSS
eukprot:Nitzschia sp. Nitz4//scaffold106_size73319//22485//26103//NITZ4_005732-RA/size73319-augustus-gene-0.10-mRNA-1//-1//CDS//3329532508//3761//frame0